ncbi:hypothetical protein [Ferrigenium kumadai]|uniref:hypothetical protein n=1 Tax=Ferrigenium kumadai TaxID=1682490 RepID=UPI001BB3E1A8|nr:hypothetical protein [Ferrigenium kumadai]
MNGIDYQTEPIFLNSCAYVAGNAAPLESVRVFMDMDIACFVARHKSLLVLGSIPILPDLTLRTAQTCMELQMPEAVVPVHNTNLMSLDRLRLSS